MIVYLLTLIIILYSVFICDIRGFQRLKQFFYILELTLLLLVISFQWKLGIDNLAYEDFFYDIPKLHELDSENLVIGAKFQPLWYISSSLSKTLFDSYQFFLIIHAIIVNSVIFVFFRRYTPYIFTAILFFVLSMNYFYFNLDILRESLAVSCFLYSIRYLEKKEFKKYYAVCFIAFLFHISALFLFLVPSLMSVLKKAAGIKYLLIVLSFVSVLFTYFFNYFINTFAASGGLALIISQADYYNSLDKNLEHSIIGAIMVVIPAVIILYIRSRMRMSVDICVTLTIFYVFLIFCNAFVTGLSRVANYFIVPYFVCAVNTIFYSISKCRFYRLICFYFIMMFTIVVYEYSRPMGVDARTRVSHYIPYRSIFDK